MPSASTARAATRESGLGEAIAGAAGGMVTADAQAAFSRALELEPGQPKASFYLATALAQEGKLAEAVAAWQAMLAALPADSPWRGAVEQAVAEANTQACSSRNDAAPGPTQEQIDAAAAMSAEDRNAMIEHDGRRARREAAAESARSGRLDAARSFLPCARHGPMRRAMR